MLSGPGRWPVVLMGCFCGGFVGCKDTVVEVVAVSEVAVAPSSVSLSVGATQQLTASPRGTGGHALGGRTMSWSSSNGSVATVSQAGLVTGTGGGTATITATSEGKSGSATVTVPTYTLTVTRAGTGSGTVTSSPAGINCGNACQESYASGTVVTLTATAASGSVFSGWSGACTGSSNTCQVTMSQARSVTATFVAEHAVGQCDDFESYALNTWPDRWHADGNAVSEPSKNRVEADPAGGGNQVLKLYGVLGSFWAAIAYLSSEVPTEFILEVDVYNGAETIPSSGHQGRSGIYLRVGQAWQNYSRVMLSFDKDGRALRADRSVIGQYALQQWHRVRVHYQRIGTDLSLEYWMNAQHAGIVQISITSLADEERLDQIELTVHAGSGLFDNLCLRPPASP